MHYIIIGFVAMMILMGSAITYLKNQNDKLHAKTGELSQANATLNQSMTHLTNSIATVAAELTVAVNKSAQIEEQVSKQKEIFEKHSPADITNIGLHKPGLLQTRVNHATAEVFKTFEKISDPDYEP